MILFSTTIVVVFVCDVLSKWAVRSTIPFGQEISVLPFFSLVHVGNTGVAFGLFQGKNFWLLILGLIVVGFLFYWSLKTIKEYPAVAFPTGLILGGALGNLLDRIRFGRVTDFLDFFIGHWHWPSFNVADSAICVGAALLLWHNFRGPSPN